VIGRLAIIELGASNLGVGVDERLLRYSSLTSIELRSHHILSALSSAFASKSYH
jgi:hypothetical protein